MLANRDAAIGALVEAVAWREQYPMARSDDARRFVMQSLLGAPSYLGAPLRLATILFDLWPMMTRLRPFHQLPFEDRLRQVEAWERSFIRPARMLMTLYVSLSLFGLWPGDEQGGQGA